VYKLKGDHVERSVQVRQRNKLFTMTRTVTCNIKKGPSLDSLVLDISVEVPDDVKTAADLRSLLKKKKTMEEADKFLNMKNYRVDPESERGIPWKSLVEKGSDKVAVAILFSQL
jgi:hypothetical protein